jgi:hypothetical protein
MAAVAVVADREQHLAWEARQRPRAGIVAFLAGILVPASLLLTQVALRDVPHAYILDSLRQALEPGPIGAQPSLLVPVFEFYNDNAAALIGASILRALAYLALAWAITFLGAATRYRRPEMSRIIIYVGLVGAVLVAVASLLNGVGQLIAFSDFLDGSRTVDAARDISKQPLLATALLINYLGPLALVAGILLVALNAMRVGLLTKFLGVIGMIAGGTMLLPPQLVPFGPFVQAFWLIALGFVFLNLGRAGAPPAWRTGEAMPWPSRRDTAATAARQRQQSEQQVAQEDASPAPAARAHPSSKKRKRKRRA